MLRAVYAMLGDATVADGRITGMITTYTRLFRDHGAFDAFSTNLNVRQRARHSHTTIHQIRPCVHPGNTNETSNSEPNVVGLTPKPDARLAHLMLKPFFRIQPRPC